jgi:predicted component of type VI protein secretion system
MEAELIVVGGKASKGSVFLTLPAVIGRSQQVGLAIRHRTVSRRHAELFEKAGVVMIRDLGSLNGTIIDGHPIKEAPLPSGTEFTVGPLTFRVKYERNGAPSESPAPKKEPEKALEKKNSSVPVAAIASPAKPIVAPTPEPTTEIPDFEAIDEPPVTKATPKPGAAKEPKAPSPSADPFDDLLNGLP